MFKKIVKFYYNILDNKIQNWTLVVLIIALLIVFISLIIRNWDINMKISQSDSNTILTNNIV